MSTSLRESIRLIARAPLRDSTVFIFYIYKSSVHFQFSPNMAGFPAILNYFTHDGVFGTSKTPHSRAQCHCDKCFTSYKRISKQKVLLEKHQTGVQTDIRVENRSLTFCYGLIWIQTVCKGYQQTTLVDTATFYLEAKCFEFLLSAGSTHPKITEKLLTRFNSLPHIFLHREITSMQR